MISALRSIEQMRRQPRAEWDAARHISIQYRLFPSVNFSVYPEKFQVHWIFPGRTTEDGYGIHAVYVRSEPETDKELKKLEEQIRFGCEDIVNAEDFWVTSQTIPNMRAPAASPTWSSAATSQPSSTSTATSPTPSIATTRKPPPKTTKPQMLRNESGGRPTAQESRANLAVVRPLCRF